MNALRNHKIGFLVALALLGAFVAIQLRETRDDAQLAFGQTPRRASATTPEAQRKVVERYWKILLDNPRFGAAFDRVYNDAAGSDQGVDALVAKLNAEIASTQDVAKGKALVALALVQIRNAETDAAIESLRAARELAPELPQAATTLASMLLLAGRLAESCDVYEEALKLKLTDDERIEAFQRLGETYAKLEMLEKANAVWTNAIEACSERDDALAQIAEIQADAGQYRQAAELFETLEDRAYAKGAVETAVEYATAAGDMRIRLGEKDAALECFERALDKLAPSHWAFKTLRDRVEYLYLLRADYDGLVEYYQALVAKRPNDLDAAARLAVTLGSLGRYEDAQGVVDAGLKRAPKDDGLRRVSLELAVAQGRYDRADAIYGELDALKIATSDDLLAWGDVVLKNDALALETKRKRALEIWTRLVDERAESAALALLVVDKLDENNFVVETEKLLVRLTSADADNFELVKALAQFYFRRNRDADAFAALDAYRKQRENDADAHAARARFLRDAGFQKEALDAQRRAVALAPQDFKKRLDLCELQLDLATDASLQEDLKALDELAQTPDEMNRALTLRFRCLQTTNGVQEYLDSLDEQLTSASLDSERAELYWRKVAALLYFDDPSGALDAAFDALNADAASENLMRKIPEIVAKSQMPERTVSLLQLVIQKDAANTIDYLRSIARLQLELGDVELATRTARDIIARSQGSAPNMRAGADALLECGLVDEAIETLRRAAQIDRSDRASMLKLATLLDEIGETSEAAQIVWQIFEKSTRLEEKLSVVDALSKLYAKLDRFDELKDRLRRDAKTGDARRENAFCLSRAYMTLRDYDSARSTLEMAATSLGSHSQDDSFLLHALSNLAELQNDLAAAVRYQERLCDVDDSRAESDRLLALYRRLDDKSKAREYLKRKILPRDPLWKQLESVDVLASAQDYDAAKELLDEIERKFPANWEILARRIEIEAWSNAPDTLELIRRAESQTKETELDSKSSKLVAVERDRNLSTATISGDAWSLGAIKGCAVLELKSPDDFRKLARQTATVVYRDKLALSDKAARSASAALAKPQAPTPAFPTYGAARFAALAWRDRFENAERRDARDPRGLEAFVNAFSTDKGDVALKYRFAALEYVAALYDNLQAQTNANDRDPKVVDKLDAIAAEKKTIVLQLARGDDLWRAEAFPAALEELATARDANERETIASFLVDSLDKSLTRGALDQDAAVWNRAAAALDALDAAGMTQAAQRARELVAKASTRDYAVLLNDDADKVYSDYDVFRATLREIEPLIERQLRNRADVEKARERLGDSFAARIQIELKRVFGDENREELERELATFDDWKTFGQKISFGRSVLNSFVELNRRRLFEGARPNDDVVAQFDALEERVYAILRDAIELNARLQSVFAEKEGKRLPDAQGNFAVADIFGYLARNDQVAFNLAAYLIDKSLYGSERPESILDSGALFELAAATFFALDVAVASETDAHSFNRLERFRAFLKEQSDAESETIARYAKKILEVEETVVAIARAEVEPETVESLRAKALERLQTTDANARSNESPLLIALALLAKYERNDEEALDYALRVPCLSHVDVKARELAILEAFDKPNSERVKERKREAVETLVGRRLDEKEATRLLAVLERDGETQEAVKIRKRLQAFATSQKVVVELLDALVERADGVAELDDEDVVFALRVFRTPSWTIKDPVALADMRAKALLALAAAGKLTQTRQNLERLVEAAPGAVELVLRLADIKIQLGENEDAKEILAAISANPPVDPTILADYASTIARAGETDQAREILASAYAKKPDEYFAATQKPDFWTTEDDLNFLNSVDSEQIAPYAFATFSLIMSAREDEKLRPIADELLLKFWQAQDARDDVKAAIQTSAVKLVAQSQDSTLIPYVLEWTLNSIRPNSNDTEPYPDYPDVHRVIQWSADRPETLSIATLRALDKERDFATLNDFATQLDGVLAKFDQQRDPNPARQSAAFVLKIMTLARLRNVEKTVDAIKIAETHDNFCAQGLKNDPLAVALALDYFLDARESELKDLARRYYEKAYDANPHPAYEKFYITTIYTLGLASDDADVRAKYAKLAGKKLTEVLALASKAELASTKRVAGSLETLESIDRYVHTLATALEAAGEVGVVDAALENSGALERAFALNDDVVAADEWRAFFRSIVELHNRLTPR